MKNILPIIIIVAAIAGITIYSQSQKTPQPETKMMESRVDENETMMNDDSVMMEKDNTMMKTDEIMMDNTPGSFVNYEDVNISELTGNIVLDFSATWCPSCRSFKKDVEASLSDIPSDLTLVLVDYDSNKDLRKQYGVTSQHTFIQIDKQGNKINMWSGGNTLESLFPNIK